MKRRPPQHALRAAYPAVLFSLAMVLSGCHSAFVQATVINHTGGIIHVFELDYPNASFGGSELAPGAEFHSRFKILGTGSTKVSWTDISQREHTVSGPELREGQEGKLTIALEPSTAVWAAQLQ